MSPIDNSSAAPAEPPPPAQTDDPPATGTIDTIPVSPPVTVQRPVGAARVPVSSPPPTGAAAVPVSSPPPTGTAAVPVVRPPAPSGTPPAPSGPSPASSAVPPAPSVVPPAEPTAAADPTGPLPAVSAAVPPVSSPAAEPATRFFPPADQTGLLGVVPPPPDPSGGPELPPPPPPRPGEQVIPLRAVRDREGGYRSVHSALTRTTAGTVIRTGLRGVGEVLITVGIIVLLFAGYEVWGKSAVVASHQNELDRQLDASWAEPTPTEEPEAEALGLPPGHAVARVYIPKISKHWVVVEGVEPDDIRYAPGRYPTGAMPGEIGNFAVAGHRNPATFWDLDKVVDGDLIVVETRDTWYTYRVTRNHIVLPSAVEVVAAVPGDLNATPTEAMLTLTTCNPKWDNYERLIVHAELVESQSQDDGVPELVTAMDL